MQIHTQHAGHLVLNVDILLDGLNHVNYPAVWISSPANFLLKFAFLF